MTVLHHLDTRLVGYGSSISAAFCTIKYCEKNNLLCHIDIRNPMYGNQNQNLWDLCFKQPFGITVDDSYDIRNTTDPFRGGYWEYMTKEDLDNLRNKEYIKREQETYKKYFTIRDDDIISKVDSFYEQYQGKKLLGIHRRGRDQLNNGHAREGHKLNLFYLYSMVDSEIEQFDYLYLCSDEHYIYDNFKKRYGNKLIFVDSKDSFVDSNEGLHYVSLSRPEQEKNIMLKNLLIEMLLLAKCDRLLLVNSNFSQTALYLSGHLNYKFYDEHVNYEHM